MNPLKLVFAMEYVLQGLANPFQGITYQPFFRHLRYHYGLSEAATQTLFSKSYLAWSFKPIMGFFIDAFGKTKVILAFLLTLSVGFYLLTPLIDLTYLVFFHVMFLLSMFLAATDVAVDRATVVAGEEEAKASGKSKAATVGLNQAICWAAIYGTNIFAAVSGGWIAEHVKLDHLLVLLAVVPLVVLLVVMRLPKDKAALIPLKASVANFWHGLNTGPVLWIILFYFLFHFQPAMGALWTNHLIEDLHFSQTQVGIADGASYFGYFVGVLIFAFLGIRWQDRLGLKRLFKIFILLSIAVNLTQYLLVEPLFSQVTGRLSALLPLSITSVRLVYLCLYNFMQAVFLGVIRMSTFSLVGAVIPAAAAGSLFAGFMSVANLAYSFSYSTGAWLYDHGLAFGPLRALQQHLFGIPARAGNSMSINLLILLGSLAYLLSFLAAHMLPDKRQTRLGAEDPAYQLGPTDFKRLGKPVLRQTNRLAILLVILVLVLTYLVLHVEIIPAIVVSFFSVVFLRRLYLVHLYKQQHRPTIG